MSTYGTIERWKSRLAENQEADSVAVDRSTANGRLNERVYRYLLSSYGNAMEKARQEEASRAAQEEMEFVDHRTENFGALPKSIQRIRTTLKKVHIANGPAPQPGPLLRGLSHREILVVFNTSGN